MILFFEYGRLGNQLFQYAALKELYPRHHLVFFGCRSLKKVLSKVDATIVERERVPRSIMLCLLKLFNLLAKLRIIGVISEVRSVLSYLIKTKHGLLQSIFLLKPAFFQHETILRGLSPEFGLSNELIDLASNWLGNKKIAIQEASLTFVHIRRGDYLSWPSRDSPAVLDKAWYIRAMNQIRTKIQNPKFLIVTDDIFYARDCFGQESDVVISDNDQYVDLALMSLCRHGILSASSFAWWGGWFSMRNNDDQSMYIAPKYWGGHRKREWMPEGFVANWLIYLE